MEVNTHCPNIEESIHDTLIKIGHILGHRGNLLKGLRPLCLNTMQMNLNLVKRRSYFKTSALKTLKSFPK